MILYKAISILWPIPLVHFGHHHPPLMYVCLNNQHIWLFLAGLTWNHMAFPPAACRELKVPKTHKGPLSTEGRLYKCENPAPLLWVRRLWVVTYTPGYFQNGAETVWVDFSWPTLFLRTLFLHFFHFQSCYPYSLTAFSGSISFLIACTQILLQRICSGIWPKRTFH